MKFLLLSRHTGDREVRDNEKEQNVKELMEWWSLLKVSIAFPLSGGKSITLEGTEDYIGDVEGMLVFEAESIEKAIEMTKKSPGLKYGWTHDILKEVILN